MVVRFILFLLILYSCKEAENPFNKILKSNIANKFKGYEIGPFRGVRTIIDPTGETLSFRLNAVRKIELLESVPDSVKETVEDIRKTLNDNGIIAVIAKNGKALIYTSYSDSSYNEVIRADKSYFDNDVINIQEPDNLAYRYVFVYLFPEVNRSSALRDLNEMTHLRKLNDNWYYFRTFRYNEYAYF